MFFFRAEEKWNECYEYRVRALSKARRAITRDARNGKWTSQEYAKKAEALKMQYFMPASIVASSWEGPAKKRETTQLLREWSN